MGVNELFVIFKRHLCKGCYIIIMRGTMTSHELVVLCLFALVCAFVCLVCLYLVLLGGDAK